MTYNYMNQGRAHKFTSIYNFRDLGESIATFNTDSRRLYIGMIFRSATLDYATNDEMDLLVRDFHVKTILDLRSELEAKLSELGKPFTTFPITANLKLEPSDMIDPNPNPDPDHPRISIRSTLNNPRRKQSMAGGSIACGTRKTIMVNFAGPKFRKNAVWWPASLWCKVRLAGLILAGKKMSAAKLAGVEVMNCKKLEGLYRDFIDFCDQEINEALHILAEPSNYPILVHCTHGKDRTGIVIALALAVVGVDEEQICQDYAKSTEGLLKIHAKMIEELAVNGLDPCFAETPYSVMKATFAYIKERYGSVDGYIRHIGFGANSCHRLKTILVDKHQGHAIPHSSSSSIVPSRTTARRHSFLHTLFHHPHNATTAV